MVTAIDLILRRVMPLSLLLASVICVTQAEGGDDPSHPDLTRNPRVSAFEQFKQFPGISTVVPAGGDAEANVVRFPRLGYDRVTRISTATPRSKNSPVRFVGAEEPVAAAIATGEMTPGIEESHRSGRTMPPSLISLPVANRADATKDRSTTTSDSVRGSVRVAVHAARQVSIEFDQGENTPDYDAISARAARHPLVEAIDPSGANLDSSAQAPRSLAADIPASRTWETRFQEQRMVTPATPVEAGQVRWESSAAVPPYWRELDEVVTTAKDRITRRDAGQ